MDQLISYDEAMAIIGREPVQALTERRELVDAAGCTLAEPILSRYPSPAFTNSSMDGYAVASSLQALAIGTILKVRGRIVAGDRLSTLQLAAGEAVKIMTGAPVPACCDAIIPVEWIEAAGDAISLIQSPVVEKQFIRYRGEDYPENSVLFEAGHRLRALDILTLASAGYAQVTVRRAPALTLWQSGDELLEPGQPFEVGKVFNASSSFLRVIAQAQNIAVNEVRSIPDRPAEVRDWALKLFAQQKEPQLLLTTGAVSKGDHDFIPSLAADLGFETLFHRVAIKPGKPIFLAKHPEHGYWLGLPGNPISTAVTWHCFVRPLLAHVFGIGSVNWESQTMVQPANAPQGLTAFFRGQKTSHGVMLAGQQGSAHHSGSRDHNLLVRCDAWRGKMNAGQGVMTLNMDDV